MTFDVGCHGNIEFDLGPLLRSRHEKNKQHLMKTVGADKVQAPLIRSRPRALYKLVIL